MRKLLALAACLGTVVIAAGTAGAATETHGVTKDSVTLGVTYPDLSSLGGTVSINHGDYQKSWNAIVGAANASGGAGGREIRLAFGPIPLGKGNAPYQEACVKLTEDVKVFAVSGFFLGDSQMCYLETRDTPVLGGSPTPELQARAKAPWVTLDQTAANVAASAQTLVDSKVLKGRKVGIINNSNEQSLADSSVYPAFDKAKIAFTKAAIDSTVTDVTAQQQLANTIVEKFKADGVESIVTVGNANLAIGTALGKTTYRPNVYALNTSALQVYAKNASADPTVLAKMQAVGSNEDFNEPKLQKCYATVGKAVGVTIQLTVPAGEPDWKASAGAACKSTALFVAMMDKAGKNPTVASFGKSVDKLGTIDIPGYGPTTWDKKAKSFIFPVYFYNWDATTRQLVEAKPAK